VIEFNVRFGDPEAQVVLPRIDGALARTLMAAATGRLSETGVRVSTDCCVGVVLASRGYPASAESGRPIDGLTEAGGHEDALVFHAGTRLDNGRIVTAGGRVLTVVGRGADFETAMDAAYGAVDVIHFDGMQCRRDIGRKALRRHG